MKKLVFGITSAIVIGLFASCSNNKAQVILDQFKDDEHIIIYYCPSDFAVMNVIKDCKFYYEQISSEIFNNANAPKSLYLGVLKNVILPTYYNNKKFTYRDGYYLTIRYDDDYDCHLDYLGYLSFKKQPKIVEDEEFQYDCLNIEKCWLQCWE